MGFKLIPAGTFIMGDTKVKKWTPHEVILTTSFKMGVHEVTQAQYEQVMGVNPSRFRGANHPVATVTWDDAVKFCRRLSDLPAEKAARDAAKRDRINDQSTSAPITLEPQGGMEW